MNNNSKRRLLWHLGQKGTWSDMLRLLAKRASLKTARIYPAFPYPGGYESRVFNSWLRSIMKPYFDSWLTPLIKAVVEEQGIEWKPEYDMEPEMTKEELDQYEVIVTIRKKS